MTITLRSFAKINLGLAIGPRRKGGFHELRTIYQTINLHDRLRVSIDPGEVFTTKHARKRLQIEIRSRNEHVPLDETNTCWLTAEKVMKALGASGTVVVEIFKRLPVQGGLGAASGNAVSTMLGIERILGHPLPGAKRLRIAQSIGSDVPVFLFGGTCLGSGHGERISPLPDLPKMICVVATPGIGVSTPQAFRDWDEKFPPATRHKGRRSAGKTELTMPTLSDRIEFFSRNINFKKASRLSSSATGVPAKGRNRAEALLLDLVRTGIENDFEKVVFQQHPELGEVKRVLLQHGAGFASLSGSGSTVFGLFTLRKPALLAARQLERLGIRAQLTTTLSRDEYWQRIFV